MAEMNITPDLAQALGYYVYAYVDPRDKKIFYIGKGIGSRATEHLSDNGVSEKVDRIRQIRNARLEPVIDILAHGLRDDEEATRVEAALIEVIGIDNLTNQVKGHLSNIYPRRGLSDLIIESKAESAQITDPALLIRINKQFRYDMSAEELYEYTRGIWVIGPRRERAKFVMAVYAGIVREGYEVESWHHAGSTHYKCRDQTALATKSDRRWEFIGSVAAEEVRERYKGRSVAHLFRPGQQSPVVGVGL